MNDPRVALRLRIEGRVQGVWFRQWMVEEAQALGVDGWVRNRADGSVEAVVAGDAVAVERLVAACRRGPSRAQVTQLLQSPAEDPGAGGFSRRSTV